jgi:hypothetical protein
LCGDRSIKTCKGIMMLKIHRKNLKNPALGLDSKVRYGVYHGFINKKEPIE